MHPIDALGRPMAVFIFAALIGRTAAAAALGLVRHYLDVRARRARVVELHEAACRRIAAADRARCARGR